MNKNVLIVDDSPTVRKFVSVSLSMQGFNVMTACDGMDALEKLPQKKFDLVITDLNMPNMDGFELIKALRENPEYKELPVVILTSLGDEANKEQGAKLGVDSYVVKPFSLEKIQYEVSKYISWTE
jgi:two-component system chemotaxis response regulator CheY